MKYTQYFHLKKPDEEDPVKIGDLNDNMDIVEAEIGSGLKKPPPYLLLAYMLRWKSWNQHILPEQQETLMQ